MIKSKIRITIKNSSNTLKFVPFGADPMYGYSNNHITQVALSLRVFAAGKDAGLVSLADGSGGVHDVELFVDAAHVCGDRGDTNL